MTNSIRYPTESFVFFQESHKFSNFTVMCKHNGNETPCTKIKDDINYSTNDKLSELLVKYSIHCFTEFHLAKNTLGSYLMTNVKCFHTIKPCIFFRRRNLKKS